jgi:hypothetical protein
MSRARAPLFLERDDYRRRRLMDAARILPVLGAILFLLPLLWEPQHTPLPDTAAGGTYLFAVWGLMILAAALLARRLAARHDPPASAPPPAGREGPGA